MSQNTRPFPTSLFFFSEDGEISRSSLFVSGKFADFKRQASHIVDIPGTAEGKMAAAAAAALPRLGPKPLKDDWSRERKEEYTDSGKLMKRISGRSDEDEEEESVEARMLEAADEDEGSEYEDYEEDDGEPIITYLLVIMIF
jgi:hypothetical protein